MNKAEIFLHLTQAANNLATKPGFIVNYPVSLTETGAPVTLIELLLQTREAIRFSILEEIERGPQGKDPFYWNQIIKLSPYLSMQVATQRP